MGSKVSRIEVLAPLEGRVIELAEVPDPVFAGALVGPGAAIDPDRSGGSRAFAPVSGRLVKLHPHAYIVQTPDGFGVLTHLGIDTVQLADAGFELLAAEGDEVSAGTPVVAWNPATVESGGRSPVVPVIALGADASSVRVVRPGPVASGAGLFVWAAALAGSGPPG